MDKVYRRTQIIELVRAGEVGTQQELRRKLAHRGIHVTQATVSRDIEELGLAKTRSGYRLPDAGVPQPPLRPTLAVLLKEFLTGVRHTANLVIVKTRPGNAHSVAAALDAEPWKDVVGTVAGDDTIFVATPNFRKAAAVCRRIRALAAG